MAARSSYQTMPQGFFESIIAYMEHFNAALKGYNEQKNLVMSEKYILMDFFHGLDNARHAGFKKDILNSLKWSSQRIVKICIYLRTSG